MTPIIFPAAIFFIGAILIPFLKGKVQKGLIIATPLAALIDILLIKPQASWSLPFLNFKIVLLQADKLSLFVAYIFVLIGFLAIFYSINVKQWTHHTAAFVYIGSSLGVVFAGDFFSLYIFWEIMALSSTALICCHRSEASLKAAARYLIMHLIGGVILLAGILTHYMSTGSIEVGMVKAGLPFALVLIGVGFNAAFILLHTWLPDAYPQASFAASVFLSVYTTKVAVYMLARVAPGVDVVAYMGGIMAVYGVTFALLQNNVRKLLSYHIISQVGYMVAGVGIGTALAVNGGIFHLFNHILYKSLLFMTIGAVIYTTGREELTELGGLSRKMPITTIAAIVAAFSISGVPLFNGFTSKGMVFEAAHNKEVLYLMLELAAVGTFLSFLKFLYFGFLRKNENIKAKEAPLSMTISMAVTAFLCVLIGIYPNLVVKIFPYPTEFHFYSLKHVVGSSQLLLATLLIFIFAKKFYAPHKWEILDFDYFYVKGARGVLSLAGGANRLNNAFEKRLSYLIPRLFKSVNSLFTLSEYIKKVVFAIFVDMWLPQPVSSIAVWRKEGIPKNRRKIGKIVDRVAALRQEIRRITGSFGLQSVDKMINMVGALTMVLSRLIGFFDLRVVDGIVNGVGSLTKLWGRKLRPIQTGRVQNYALALVGGAITLFVIVLLITLFR